MSPYHRSTYKVDRWPILPWALFSFEAAFSPELPRAWTPRAPCASVVPESALRALLRLFLPCLDCSIAVKLTPCRVLSSALAARTFVRDPTERRDVLRDIASHPCVAASMDVDCARRISIPSREFRVRERPLGDPSCEGFAGLLLVRRRFQRRFRVIPRGLTPMHLAMHREGAAVRRGSCESRRAARTHLRFWMGIQRRIGW